MSKNSTPVLNGVYEAISELIGFDNKLPKGKVYQFVCPERDITARAPHSLFLGIRAKTVKWRLIEYTEESSLILSSGFA